MKKNTLSLLVVGNGTIGISHDNKFYISNHTADFLIDLRNRGFVPSYMAMASLYDNNSDLLNFELNKEGLRSVYLTKGNFIGSIYRLAFNLFKTDYVYIFYPGSLAKIIAFLCLLVGKPYGVYVRGERYLDGKVSSVILKRTRFILTVSPNIENSLSYLNNNVKTIRPMLNINKLDFSLQPPIIIPPKCWKILFVGNLNVDKGVPELLDAILKLHKEGFSYELRFVGGGTLYNDLKVSLRDGPLSKNVTLTGLFTDKNILMSEYKNADIFILPTHHEGFPRVLYEAMTQGLPIITTMVGGIPGRMRDNINCLAIDVRNCDSIVLAVKKLTNDLDLYNKIGSSGYMTAWNVFEELNSHGELVCEMIEENYA